MVVAASSKLLVHIHHSIQFYIPKDCTLNTVSKSFCCYSHLSSIVVAAAAVVTIQTTITTPEFCTFNLLLPVTCFGQLLTVTLHGGETLIYVTHVFAGFILVLL
jgi:hypothetical protein